MGLMKGWVVEYHAEMEKGYAEMEGWGTFLILSFFNNVKWNNK